MDRKIILPLLVASAVIGCLSVQINIPQDRDSFFPGFLLYLSGNLEAGSTATAYIETNFTDPFAARLDFVHSYEDRHFYGEARIVNGSGVIEFEVPDVDYWYGTVNFTGIMEGSRQMFTSPKTNFIYIYQHSQKVTFIETDKPLYKPGQEVKFRLLTIDSQFKPETSNVPKIQIESPNQIRLEQWRDVERPDGLVDLSFQLISEPALGEYKIKAYVNDAWVTQPFKVDEYVLPKVEVTVNAPSFVLITAKEYSFQVCAKYTYGQPVRGSVFGEVGKLRKDYFFYYRRRPNPVLGGDEEEPDVELIDAISFSGELGSEGCLESSVSGLNLSSYDTPYYRHSLAVRATVVEATTGDEFIEVTDASKLETVPVNINLESPESFKPGIPYHGRIKVTYPDGKPAPNEELNITATVDRETAYTGDHTSDSEGIVEFDIPYAVVDKSISLQVEAKAYPYQYNPYGYNIYSPTMRFNLDPSYSPTGRYLQIAPILHSVNAGDELTFQVFYTSDDDAVTSDFKVQLISRNKLVHAGATQEGNSRRRRAVMLDAHEQLTECQHQAQEAVGKGDQSSFVPVCEEDGSFSRQQCMPSTNRCWCVNPENGLEIPLTSRQSPDEEYLDCEDTEEEGPIEVPIGELGPPDAFNQCPEGFKFGDGVKKCVRETECERQVREVMGKGLLGAQTPTCDEAGNFMLEQCHGSSGYCWCVDTVTGLELPGTKTGPTENNTDCEAFIARQETECQRQVHEVTGKGLLGARTPMCDEAGNFMLEQCHGSSGYCWCVDTVTGQELPGTKTGPTESNTDCEAFIARQETECQRQLREVELKGLALGGWRPNCDEDGNFVPEQCHGSSGYCWCVDILTGLEIPETETGPTEDNVDCEAVTPVPTLKLQTLETLTLVLQTPEPIVHVDPQALHEVSFTVPITAGMSPEAKLLVYYTSPEGEVVADSVNIKINEAFENEVKLEFLDKQVLPGSETTLKVSAANGSLCGIGIVDKSVYVLGGENKVTPKKLFSAFDLSTRTTYDDRDCPSRWYRFRKKRDIIFPGFFHSTVNYVDSSEAFSNAGLKAITNYDLNVAPCAYSTPEVVAYLGRSNGDFVVDSEVSIGAGSTPKEDKVRSYFPSTWLWSLQRISNAEVEVPLTVPHTITDWIANGLCTNVEKGLGVSPPVVLRAFQSFFLSMSLPYSIIRTEKTPIKVTVFNYLDQCLVVRVTLEENEGFVLSGSNEYTVAVPAGEATTVTYKVAAFVLGSIPLQVSAKSISDDEFLCGNEAVAGPAGSKDAVRRDLKVKPEGEQETTTESAYFCLEEDETYNKHVSLKIPPQRVPGTEVGEISVTGDLVGNTLSNVESMLRMPYGCGEQNLVSMVPNIVALQYLESVGEATPEITAEAKKYILSGYQRELNYRRSDNSYAAFGESNPSGSTFLTAFVVRTYAHAQKFVDVDEEDLYVTIQWLRSIQNEDGSFRTVGYLAHKAMKGGVNNNVTLAAYMVATFLEAGYDSQDKTVAAALAYIDSRLDTLEDTYSMALLAYAYALAGSDRFDDVYEMLQEVAVESEGTKHWESNRDLPEYASYYQDSSKAQNIEMTAYVLRAMVFKRIPNLEVEGSVIARWLVSQRNPRGGFSSTQDTVIGLTALAEFSALGTSENSDLTLTMNIRGGSTLQFDVDYDNRFIVQKGSFEDFPAEVSVSAEGQGCALYSISGDYYIKRDKQTLDPFTLDVKAKAQEPKARKRRDAHEGEEHEHEYEEEEATCEKFTISVSARYNGEDGASNMAIINFRPVSGFVFDKESLEAMLEKYFFVKRYEINEDIITFYFDEITNDNVEFEFDVTKEFDVEDAKPAFMNILDYYENGLKVAEEFEFVCADDVLTSSPSTTYTTPPSPSGFASSSSTMTPDFDECTIPDVCGGPEYQCVNYPGTYECICADGYALDEDEENCVEVPSCPMCSGEGFPLGVDELICASDSIRVMKVRGDGSFRPLNDLLLNEDIIERIYYDVEMNEACTCDVISSGERIIVVASSDHVGPSSGKRDERVLLDEDVVIVLSVSVNKKDIKEILDSC